MESGSNRTPCPWGAGLQPASGTTPTYGRSPLCLAGKVGLEPTYGSLTVSSPTGWRTCQETGRGRRARTADILVPNQVCFQTALHSENEQLEITAACTAPFVALSVDGQAHRSRVSTRICRGSFRVVRHDGLVSTGGDTCLRHSYSMPPLPSALRAVKACGPTCDVTSKTVRLGRQAFLDFTDVIQAYAIVTTRKDAAFPFISARFEPATRCLEGNRSTIELSINLRRCARPGCFDAF